MCGSVGSTPSAIERMPRRWARLTTASTRSTADQRLASVLCGTALNLASTRGRAAPRRDLGDSSVDSNAMRSGTVRRRPSTYALTPERPLQRPCWLLLISGRALSHFWRAWDAPLTASRCYGERSGVGPGGTCSRVSNKSSITPGPTSCSCSRVHGGAGISPSASQHRMTGGDILHRAAA